MSIARFSICNPVPINLIVIGILVLGTIVLFNIPQELFPPISLNWAFITVPYPGVSPEEIEKLINIPIEDEIADVDNIDFISSVAFEGLGVISVKFETIDDDEYQRSFLDLKAEVDKVSLPDDVEDPEVNDFTTSDFMPVVNVVIAGRLPEKELRELADDLKRDILDIKEVSQVELGGIRDREIWVEVDPSRLDAYNLSLTSVINAISNQNMNIPGGTIEMGRSEYIVRTVGEFS